MSSERGRCIRCGSELPAEDDASSRGGKCVECWSGQLSFGPVVRMVGGGAIYNSGVHLEPLGRPFLSRIVVGGTLLVDPPAGETYFKISKRRPSGPGDLWRATVEGPTGELLDIGVGENWDEALSQVIRTVVFHDEEEEQPPTG